MLNFNGMRLRNARLYRGLTVEELANKVKVTKQAISLYENDKNSPSFEKIIVLAQSLKFPYEYFMQSENFKIESGATYFRSLMKTSKKYRKEQIVKMEHLAAIFSVLKDYIIFQDLKLPTSREYSSPAEAAHILREYWGLGNEPISNIIPVLESNGIIVTMFPTSTNDIDAFSQHVRIEDSSVFLIALSKNKNSAARIHFDVAHELGHIILHGWGDDPELFTRDEFKNKEKEANEFAAAFLMPEDSFTEDVLKNYSSFDYYCNLKRKWKVSIAAMLYRSRNLNLISYSQYQYMMRVMQKKMWRTNEPLDDILMTAQPSVLKDAVALLLNHNVFNSNEFMNELAKKGIPMEYQEVETLLGLPHEMLKPQRHGKIIELKEEDR